MQTAVPGVYATGDANGKVMSAHAAYRESAAAINNILGKTDEIDYLAIPQVVFTFSRRHRSARRSKVRSQKALTPFAAKRRCARAEDFSPRAGRTDSAR